MFNKKCYIFMTGWQNPRDGRQIHRLGTPNNEPTDLKGAQMAPFDPALSPLEPNEP
jgi:hypothetical protein